MIHSSVAQTGLCVHFAAAGRLNQHGERTRTGTGAAFCSFMHGWVSATSSSTPPASQMTTLCLFGRSRHTRGVVWPPAYVCNHRPCDRSASPAPHNTQHTIAAASNATHSRSKQAVWLPVLKSSSFPTLWHSDKSARSVFNKQVRTSSFPGSIQGMMITSWTVMSLLSH